MYSFLLLRSILNNFEKLSHWLDEEIKKNSRENEISAGDQLRRSPVKDCRLCQACRVIMIVTHPNSTDRTSAIYLAGNFDTHAPEEEPEIKRCGV